MYEMSLVRNLLLWVIASASLALSNLSWGALSTRAIPFRTPVDHWKDVLPFFERELEMFSANADYLRTHPNVVLQVLKPYLPAEVEINSTDCMAFTLYIGARPHSRLQPYLDRINPELVGLTAVQISPDAAQRRQFPIEFVLASLARLFVGVPANEEANLGLGWNLYSSGTVLVSPYDGYDYTFYDVYSKEYLDGRSMTLEPERVVVLGFARADQPLADEITRRAQFYYLFSNKIDDGEDQ